MPEETWATMVQDPWDKAPQCHFLADTKEAAKQQSALLRRNGPRGRRVSVEEVGDTHSKIEARTLRAQALSLLSCSHSSPAPREDRDHCGACALKGYGALSAEESDSGHASPNYAGWARVYTQAGKTVPECWSEDFSHAFDGDSAYSLALRKDVRTFGSPRK